MTEGQLSLPLVFLSVHNRSGKLSERIETLTCLLTRCLLSFYGLGVGMLDEFQSVSFRVLDLWNNYKALHVCYNVQVMVANVRCEEIANENLAKLASNEVLSHSFSVVWRHLVTICKIFI